MVLRRRAILLATSIILFLLVAPTVIFFARGYRYDFANHRIISTGTLVIKTEPRDAVAILDGQLLEKTPLVKRFLLPKEYTLEIKKEGYHSWNKIVRIHPKQATLVSPLETEKIYLLSSTQLPSLEATTTAPVSAEEASLPALYKIIEGVLYQVGDTLQKINSPVQYASWQKESQTLLYGNDNEIWLYRPLSNSPSNLLVTRSLNKLGLPIYHQKAGFVFVATEHQIKAIEVTDRGRPNVFTLAKTRSETVELAIDPEGTILTYLDGGMLARLKLR